MNKVFIVEGFSITFDLPEGVPAWPSPGWVIYNAARPIPGQETWTGPFLHGVFYAAIKLDHRFAAEWIKRCQELDGSLLIDVTDNDLEKYKRYVAERFNVDVEQFSRTDVIKSFLNSVKTGNYECS